MKSKKEITKCINKVRKDMNMKGIYISPMFLGERGIYCIKDDEPSKEVPREYWKTVGIISVLKWVRGDTR